MVSLVPRRSIIKKRCSQPQISDVERRHRLVRERRRNLETVRWSCLTQGKMRSNELHVAYLESCTLADCSDQLSLTIPRVAIGRRNPLSFFVSLHFGGFRIGPG